MGRVKYILLLAALAAVFSVARLDLDGLRFATDERLALSSKLEDISQIEADAIKFLNVAGRVVEGSMPLAEESARQALANIESKLNAAKDFAASSQLDPFHGDRASIDSLASALQFISPKIQDLRAGNEAELRLIKDRLEPLLPTASRLAHIASETRKSRSIELLEAQKEAADSVNRLQLNCAMIGIIAMFLLARDLAHARNLNLELRLREERIRDLATRDSLTGLYNRRHFDERVKSLQAENASHWFLLLVDLDGFKAINDNHGHIAGDHVLREVARRIEDVAGSSALTARLGGDEFAIVATLDQPRAERLAKTLLKRIAEPIRLEGNALVVSASIGIAETRLSDQCPEAKDIFQRADQALYVAKYNGKNNYRFCDVPIVRDKAADKSRMAVEPMPSSPNVIDIASRLRRMVSISYGRM